MAGDASMISFISWPLSSEGCITGDLFIKVDGGCQAEGEHFVPEAEVLEIIGMCKCKGLYDFDKEQTVTGSWGLEQLQTFCSYQLFWYTQVSADQTCSKVGKVLAMNYNPTVQLLPSAHPPSSSSFTVNPWAILVLCCCPPPLPYSPSTLNPSAYPWVNHPIHRTTTLRKWTTLSWISAKYSVDVFQGFMYVSTALSAAFNCIIIISKLL